MRVKTEHLIPGCILSKDIYKKGETPIAKKKTVLREKHIDMLSRFLIDDVLVEVKLEDGRLFNPEGIIQEENLLLRDNDLDVKDVSPFKATYIHAVEKYKAMFQQWRGGMKINSYAVRLLVTELCNLKPTKEDLISLYQLSTIKEYDAHHAIARSIISITIGKELKLKQNEQLQLGMSALLADAGMARLSIRSTSSEKLKVYEMKELHEHPLYSYDMLKLVKGVTVEAKLGVLQHHERIDGSGYPHRVTGEKIHLYGKVIAVADTFHAMCCDRTYIRRKSPYEALEVLNKDCFGLLDPVVMATIIQLLNELKIGEKVRLTNGEEGVIVYLQANEPTRPSLRMSKTNELFQLTSTRSLFIDSIVRE
ncbi:HD-GYP domain-containing protein [Alteribacter aurantiacus]|uniref:HD-GYP domain-containing protein n=1 Tax=Alteribacter aurantiacus TaxID=254410 RepID=UPI0004153545|nr:HD domain-containing phosphohydrolase [Alteribacter aurantiacus]